MFSKLLVVRLKSPETAPGPLALPGMPVDVAALPGFAISVQLIVQHTNVAYALRPFEKHLSIGRLHHLYRVN